MRILHVIPTLDPMAGGPPMVAIRLAAAQASLGNEVHFICYRSGAEGQKRIADETRKIPGIDGVRLHLLPPITLTEQVLAINAGRMLNELIPTMDAVHIHCVWESILLRAANAARRTRVRYVILTSGMLEPWPMSRGRFKKGFALAIGYRRMLDDAAALQLLNADEEASCRRLGIRAPGAVIPNGVFMSEIEPLPAKGTFRANHPGLGERPFVLFLSRLAAQKGVDLLVPAFEIVARENPHLCLAVAGPDFGMLPVLRRQIAEARLEDRVHVIGPLYGADKFAAMADAKCFCLPSRHEGFSVAIVEALAAGLPAVISRECHFPELAAAGAGEIAELSAESIAAALVRVIEPTRREKAARAARDYVLANLTWERIAERTIQVYRGPGGLQG
jgi:glycosyltransferase involved in cell wall biosynthesis